LDVIIILGKKAPKIFEDLNLFKDFSINTELLLQNHTAASRCFVGLTPTLHSFENLWRGYRGLTCIPTFHGNYHQIQWVHFPEVPPHHPAIP
jgi:hypothetical protein